MSEKVIANMSDLTAIANAVRNSTGSTETYSVPELSVAAVNAINNGGSGATPDWNAQEGEPGYIANKTHGEIMGLVEILPETVFSLETEGMTATPLNGSLTIGEMAVVTYNSVDYESEIISIDADGMTMKMCGNPMIIFGDDTLDNGLPFAFVETPAEYAAMGVYAMFIPLDMYESGAATISVKSVGRTIQKLDDKYINKPNWNAIEGEAGNIENRTHYADKNVIIDCNKTISNESFMLGDGWILKKVSNYVLSKENLNNAELIITNIETGEEAEISEVVANDDNGQVSIMSGYGLITSVYDLEAAAANGIENITLGTYAMIAPGYSVKLAFDELVKKLDNKYIDLSSLGEKPTYELYKEIRLEEDTAEILESEELAQKQYESIFMICETQRTENTKANLLIEALGSEAGAWAMKLFIPEAITDTTQYNNQHFMYYCDNKHGYLDITATLPTGATDKAQTMIKPHPHYSMCSQPPIKRLKIYNQEGTLIPAGSTFKIWGVRA